MESVARQRTYRRGWIGPVFAVAALISPSVIALCDPATPAWLGAPASSSPGGRLMLQYVLLTAGLTAGVVSCMLAVYHWSAARRALHLFLFCILLELFYRFAYGGAVSSGILLSVPETSPRETGELLAGHALLTGCLTLVALLAVCALVASWRVQIRFALKRCVQVGAAAAFLIAVSVAIGAQQFGGLSSLRPIVRAEIQATFPFDVAAAFGEVGIGLLDARRLAAARVEFRFPNVSLADAASRGGVSEIYVVVIGETSRRTNWSLFGYPRATTPRLDTIKDDLVLFRRVTSNATNTILSVPLALTRATPATRSVARSEKSIITLLKQAGFETFWISNQERSDAWSNPISQIALEADHISFPQDMRPSERSGGFDSNLLTRLDEVLAHFPAGGKAVIFLHMEGSHFGYKARYPAAFAHFPDGQDAPRALPERQTRLVDEYDNSVLFTDFIISAVIDRLARRAGEAGLIYFSDHGERLFDNGLTDGDFGHGFPTVSRQEIEVPFFVWLSSAYQQANHSLASRLQSNAPYAAQLDSLFETITDLARVQYENRSAASSLFSDRFQPSRELEVLNTEEQTVSLPAQESAIAQSTR